MPNEFTLLPCPMCGDASVKFDYNDDDHPCVVCLGCQFMTACHPHEESAAREWNALPRKLHWTRDRPSKSGWYWFEADLCAPIYMVSVVRNAENGDLYLHYPDIKVVREVNSVSGSWAGPIPIPD